MPDGVFEQFSVDDGGLLVELLVQPAVNYALVHNRVPLARRLSITNRTGAPIPDLEVRLDLLGPDGPLTDTWQHTVTTPVRPGATIGWEDFSGFSPSMSLLRGADEAFPVDYRLTVGRPGTPDVRLVAPSSVLAHNEWFNAPALYDCLAAFVQPNTGAVETVLRAAAELLLARTGSGSLQGYQAGPERAAHIAGAVYEALRRHGINYQGLPASFENTGQKVRTTAAVLDGRLGNCLDLSVTYAACLEAAGLRPLIWLVHGHAFAGFLLEEERLSSAAVTEANLLISMVESGKAVPVELTNLGPGAQSADFTAAVQLGLAHFRAQGHQLLGVVDVYLAHRSGIRPLPAADQLAAEVQAQAEAATGTAVAGEGSIELPAGVARAKLRERADAGDDAPQQVDDSPGRVQQWKKSLLDLSLRNPLLNLPKRGKGLDLHVPVGALARLDDLIHQGKRLDVIPQDAISHVHELAGARRAQELDPEMLTAELSRDRRIYGAVVEERYQALMRGLQRDARTMQQETGSNYLYLTIGTLVHPKSGGEEAHAPLFLLPVRIEGGTGRRPYGIVADGAEVATPNHCLIEWLRIKHGLRIQELEQPARDEHGIDIAKTLEDINARLVENRLNYRLDERASLRLLQFSTFQMWRDLTDHWRDFLDNPVVAHLVRSTGATFDDPAASTPTAVDRSASGREVPVDEAELHLPIPADGSQMQAIVLAERGHSFVLEGPPGTGKSQTITNLIARAVTSGRSVLFVAEKQAALDVVKRRLRQIGLAPFALDLHGRRQSLNAIREQLREALDQYDRDDEIAWTAVETSYRTRLAPLVEYPARVHTPNGAQLSVWSAYEAVLAYGDGPTAPVPTPYLAAGDHVQQRVAQALRDLPALARSARLRPDHPWAISGLRGVDGLSVAAVTQLAADLEHSRHDLSAWPELAEVVRELPDPGGVETLLPAARLAVAGALPDRAATLRASQPSWDQEATALATGLADLHQTYRTEFATFRQEVLTQADLDGWQAEAREAAGRLFGKGKRLQAVADRLQPYSASGTTLTGDQVQQVLARLLAARTAAAGLFQQVRALGGLALPPGWLPTGPAAQKQFEAGRQATLASRALLAQRPAAWELLHAGLSADRLDVLERLVSGWRAWLGVLRTGAPELGRWAGEGGWYAAWQRDGAGWQSELGGEGLLPLQRWGALLGRADVLADAGLTGYRDDLLSARTEAAVAEEAYRRGLAVASLAERLRAGDLDYFDPERHTDQIAQFESAAERLRAAMPDHLPSVLVRRRPVQPSQRRGRYADFVAELRRKRGGKSFRELFSAYPDVVLSLTPCVLVSPASAANFLAPGAASFDLVIFDEASQIRVAEAIGAMGRGRAVVVVGDSRQMPPSSMMQAVHTGDEVPDEDGPVPEDLESILSEAVESGLPQRWLSWHYRSHDESLIAFSNRYYYENKLSSLPSPAAGVFDQSGSARLTPRHDPDQSAGVRWRRVDGRFDRGATRTNAVEADAIVAEIAQRLRDPLTAAESIGVVTFNIQQRDLILNLLEDSPDPLIREQLSESAAEPIFVKNLENVQGDERDVVLFSLAFSVNPETGQLPLNFGPLSQVGGERRLNVAITRARRQVMLFASFDPGSIDLSRTTAVGTAHLRAYCEMAAGGVDRLGDLATDRRDRRDRVRDEVAAAIREHGYEVTTGHGLSNFTVDIAVRAPGAGRWQVALMLDGPQWSRRPTVADRDGAPGLLRTIMGWPELLRFWLPSWIRDRSALLKSLDAAVTRAVAAEQAATAARQAAAIAAQQSVEVAAASVAASAGSDALDGGGPGADGPEVGESGTIEAPAGVDGLETAVTQVLPRQADGTGGPEREMLRSVMAPPVATAPPAGPLAGEPVPFVPYAPVLVGSQADADRIASDRTVRETVRAALRTVIAAEGPVEQHRLARLTLAQFGFAKTREDRRAAVLALVDPGVLRSHPVGTYAWPAEFDPDTWRGFRSTQVSSDRTFEEIAPEEIANAVCHALGTGRHLAEEELLRSTLDLLGYRRKTEKIDGLLRYGLQVAYRAGRVARADDGRYRAAPGTPEAPGSAGETVGDRTA